MQRKDDRRTDRCADKQTNRQAGKQTYKQTDRLKMFGQTDTHTHRQTEKLSYNPVIENDEI